MWLSVWRTRSQHRPGSLQLTPGDCEVGLVDPLDPLAPLDDPPELPPSPLPDDEPPELEAGSPVLEPPELPEVPPFWSAFFPSSGVETGGKGCGLSEGPGGSSLWPPLSATHPRKPRAAAASTHVQRLPVAPKVRG
jgi:hypothetical protein